MKQRPHRQAKAITILNLKGGVGKTHTAWLLASVCQERSLRLLAFDADTQGNFSGSFLPELDGKPGIEQLFDPTAEQDPHGLIRRTVFAHIDVIPATGGLARFDLSHQQEWEKSDLHLSLVDPVHELRSQYDYIVFDCPPRLSVVSFAALCASDFVIIPLEAADWGAQGIMQVTAAIEVVRKRSNSRLTLLGYLVNRYRRARAYQQSYLKQLRSHFGPLAFDTVVPDLAQFERSVIDRVPITLQAPSSEEAGIARQLFDEIERRIQGRRARHAGRRQDVRRQASAA